MQRLRQTQVGDLEQEFNAGVNPLEGTSQKTYC